jgi:hypothetical protein
MKEDYKINLDTGIQPVTRVLDAAARVKKREN